MLFSDLNNYTSLSVDPCTGERKIDVLHYVISQQGSCFLDRARVEFILTRGFGPVSEVAFTMCVNPIKKIFKR